MRYFAAVSLILCTFFLLACSSVQQTDAANPNPSILPIPVAPIPVTPAPIPNCGCNGPDCRCQSGKCDCDLDNGRCSIDCNCTQVSHKKPLTLNTAVDLALIENKPLCVWVAEVCVPCEKKLTNCLHVHVKEYERMNGIVVKDPCVIVAKPNNGAVFISGTVPGCPDDLPVQVQRILNPPAFIPQPQYFAPPPMFFGFSGGRGGC